MLTTLVTLLALHCTAFETAIVDGHQNDSQVSCLVNNVWTPKGNLTAGMGPCTDTQPRWITHTQVLANPTGTEMYAVLDKCGNGPERAMEMKKWNPATHTWLSLGEVAADNQSDPPYAQFGIDAAYVSFLPNPLFAVINGYRTLSLSNLVDGTWLKTEFGNVTPSQPVRHPEIYEFAGHAYVLYGEPRPTLYELTDGDVSEVPVQIPDPGPLYYTLYTDMTVWNGKPVVAYNYYDYPNTHNWATTVDKTRIVMFDGTNWITLSDSIQDTYGHDGVKPHLFVRSGHLYCMYFDYSSTGRPSNSQLVRGRFRVKSYDPATNTWIRVGNESPIFLLSQKFEYLDDPDGTVFFDAMVRSPPYVIQQTWKFTDNFVRFGPNVLVHPEIHGAVRPGNMVTYNGQ